MSCIIDILVPFQAAKINKSCGLTAWSILRVYKFEKQQKKQTALESTPKHIKFILPGAPGYG